VNEIETAFSDGRLSVVLDDRISEGTSVFTSNFLGRDEVKPSLVEGKPTLPLRWVHVMSKPAKGEIRGYALVNGKLHVRLPDYVGPWPELDQAVATKLGVPVLTREGSYNAHSARVDAPLVTIFPSSIGEDTSERV